MNFDSLRRFIIFGASIAIWIQLLRLAIANIGWLIGALVVAVFACFGVSVAVAASAICTRGLYRTSLNIDEYVIRQQIDDAHHLIRNARAFTARATITAADFLRWVHVEQEAREAIKEREAWLGRSLLMRVLVVQPVFGFHTDVHRILEKFTIQDATDRLLDAYETPPAVDD